MPLQVQPGTPERLLRGYVAGVEDCARYTPGKRIPTLLVCWPYARMNKYQALLYSRAAQHGYCVLPVSKLATLADVSWPGPIVLHAHWFASIYNTATCEDEAFVATEEAFSLIEAFRRRTGAYLLWTAHNLFPHNARFPKAFLELRRRTVQSADAVHLLSDDHAPLLQSAYGVPLGRTFTVPHMTYDGVYPDYMTRETAREVLDLPRSAFVYAFFGSIQPYKGIDRLIRAFMALEPDEANLRLVIAGAPVDEKARAAVLALAAADSRIIVDARRIPDDEVQVYFRATDAMVLPYSDTLNSGAALLALTFGTQLVAPDTTAFAGFASHGTVVYRDSDPSALTVALEQVRGDAGAGRRKSSKRPELSPTTISDAFFDRLGRSL